MSTELFKSLYVVAICGFVCFLWLFLLWGSTEWLCEIFIKK